MGIPSIYTLGKRERIMGSKICPLGHVYTSKRCQQCSKHSRSGRSEYGSKWDRLSRKKREMNPICEHCDKAGRTTPSKEVHHIVDMIDAPHLKYTWSNLVALCKDCHLESHGKSRREDGRSGKVL